MLSNILKHFQLMSHKIKTHQNIMLFLDDYFSETATEVISNEIAEVGKLSFSGTSAESYFMNFHKYYDNTLSENIDMKEENESFFANHSKYWFSNVLANYARLSKQVDIFEIDSNIIGTLQTAVNQLDEAAKEMADKVMPWNWKNRAEDSLPLYVAFKTEEDKEKKELTECISFLKSLSFDALKPEIAKFEASVGNYLAALASLAAQSNGEVKNIGRFRRITERELWNDRCKAYQYIM